MSADQPVVGTLKRRRELAKKSTEFGYSDHGVVAGEGHVCSARCPLCRTDVRTPVSGRSAHGHVAAIRQAVVDHLSHNPADGGCPGAAS